MTNVDETLLIPLAPYIETEENRKRDLEIHLTTRGTYQENSFLDPVDIHEYRTWNSSVYMNLDKINRMGKG